MSRHLLRLVSFFALLTLATCPATAQVTRYASAPVGLASDSALPLLNRAQSPLCLAAVSGSRSARASDWVLLSLSGIGGGLAAGAVAVAADPPVVARVLVYGLGVGAGTAITGRVLGVEGSVVGAVVGGVVGSGLVLLVAGETSDDGGEGLDAAAGIALLALTVPPLLSTGGYVLTPTLMNARTAGLALRVAL